MVGEKKVKNKKMEGLSRLFNDEGEGVSDVSGLPLDAAGTEEVIVEVSGHMSGHNMIPEDVAVSSPKDMPAFIESIRKINGYSVELLNNGSFTIWKEDKVTGKKTEVLNGNKDTCQMSSPLDQNVLKAYINAHQGKDIIVDRCKTEEAVKQLLKACKDNVPPVTIKFRAGIFEDLGITDPWITRHAMPAEPSTVEFKPSGMRKG